MSIWTNIWRLCQVLFNDGRCTESTIRINDSGGIHNSSCSLVKIKLNAMSNSISSVCQAWCSATIRWFVSVLIGCASKKGVLKSTGFLLLISWSNFLLGFCQHPQKDLSCQKLVYRNQGYIPSYFETNLSTAPGHVGENDSGPNRKGGFHPEGW